MWAFSNNSIISFKNFFHIKPHETKIPLKGVYFFDTIIWILLLFQFWLIAYQTVLQAASLFTWMPFWELGKAQGLLQHCTNPAYKDNIIKSDECNGKHT